MAIVPLLPPYAHVTQEAVQCAAQASLRYEVPELLLHAILRKENGRIGGASKNSNGTRDYGPAQVNTLWVDYFKKFGLTQEHIRDDFCTNINVSAYIVRDYFNQKKDWFQAIVSYNIGPNKWTPVRYAIGHKYATEVIGYWWAFQDYVDIQQYGAVRENRQQAASLNQAAVIPAPKLAQPVKKANSQFVFDLSNTP